MSNRNELSIVVPCYNEARNLESLVGEFRQAIGALSGIELLLVDNGSRDDTGAVMSELTSRPENSFVRSVRVDVNQGYGHGIMFGLRSSTSPFLAWTHADLQTPPEDVLHAWSVMRSYIHPERVLVRGVRQGRPAFDRFFSAGMGWFASLALGSPMYEINAQPKLFHRSLLDQMPKPPNDFTLDLYVLFVANQLKMQVYDLPVQFGRRRAGQAKGGGTLKGKAKLIKRTVAQILNLRRELQHQATQTESTWQLSAEVRPLRKAS